MTDIPALIERVQRLQAQGAWPGDGDLAQKVATALAEQAAEIERLRDE